jgi:hypothetical protein
MSLIRFDSIPTTQESLTQDPADFFYSESMDARRRRYLSKTSAARKVQAMYRRYKARSTDSRQLGTIVRSYRKANPYQIQPSAGRTVTFWRKTEINVPINQQLGFSSAGNNVNFGFALGRVIGFVNGGFTYAPVVPNASEFQALFDYYRIKSVKMQMFFSKNVSDMGGTGNPTIGLPVLIIANDFDDIQETMSLSDMLQRVGARHVQFENSGVSGINHYIKPKPSTVVVQTDVATGVQSTSNAGVTFGTQWLDCASSNIVHNGIKVFYDNQGITTSVTLGNISFVFDIEYEFKGYR